MYNCTDNYFNFSKNKTEDLGGEFYAIFSGRFKEKASHLILDFHSSINFDKRLYRYDIMGSIAHVRGLGNRG